MAKKAATKKEQKPVKTQTQIEAEELLRDLYAQDPRLRIDRGQARSFLNTEEEDLSEEGIQTTYRQRLGK